jgi:hypothetical protein
MRKRTLVAGVAVLVALVALAATATAQGKEPWVGTWKLNLAKSKYSPGPPAKSLTVTVTAPNGGIKQVVDTVPATGAALHYEATGMFDSKDVPSKGNPNADTQAFRKISDRSYEVTAKKGGKVVQTSVVVISADGKTRTNTQTGVTADGKPVKNVLVYDRQ